VGRGDHSDRENNNDNNSMSGTTASVSISAAFDGGNIKFIRTRPNELDPKTIDVVLRIKPDVYTELEKIGHMQYFCFRATLSGLKKAGQKVRYIIENAEATSYPEAWFGKFVPSRSSARGPRPTPCINGKYENLEFRGVGMLMCICNNIANRSCFNT
jgi:Cytosolic carboxypeptidase N-terminal domain